MFMATHTREQLQRITADFLSAFNTNDLDKMMSFFAEDGVYEEFNGVMNRGVADVRAAFAPQFDGAFGEMKFLDEDLFIDSETGKVMASWRCTLSAKGEPTSWRGLDLLWFNDAGKITNKLTYAKTKSPKFEAVPD